VNAPASPPVADEAVELGELTGSLGFLLRMAQVRMYETFYEAFDGLAVRPGEFTALWVIAHNPGIRQGTLARTLCIKPAHMTKLVQRLVEAGHVDRAVPPEDRRQVNLSLSPSGTAHLDRHRETFLQLDSAARNGLTDDEITRILPLLQRLAFPGDPA